MADSSNLLHRGQLRQHGGGSESSAAFASTINKAQAMEQARRSYFSCSCGLMRHEDLPRWIQVIDASTGWVSNHHRPPQPSVTACIASAFQWNTETINIWSHLLAFLATVYFIYDILTNQFFVGTKWVYFKAVFLKTFNFITQWHSSGTLPSHGWHQCIKYSR